MEYSGQFIGLVLLALALSGCVRDESYPGLVADKQRHVVSGGGWPLGDEVPIKVSIDEDQLSTIIATRGTGPVATPPNTTADKVRYEQTVLRLFAFRDTCDQKGPLNYEPDFTKRSADTEGKADCLIDDSDYLVGVPALLKNDKTGILHLKCNDLKTDTTLYYSDHYRDVGYHFFLNYIDDLVPTAEQTHRDASGVYYDLHNDGTRDFMVGAAPKLTPFVLDTQYPNVRLSATERDRILNIGNYSTYAARLGIHPRISLHHLMSQLCFYAYPADETAVDIGIESIEIDGCHDGRLFVAAPHIDNVGFIPNGNRSYISLMDKNPDGNQQSPYVTLSADRNTVNWTAGMDRSQWQNNPSTHIGGDMMVAPDSIYRMRITYRQMLKRLNPTTGQPDVVRVTAHYRLLAPMIDSCYDPQKRMFMFKPGQIYNINIGVFGMQHLEIIVTLGGWIDGGDATGGDYW